MAKLKKEMIDETDLELLATLYYLGEATATDLEKESKVDLTKAGISKRLKWLAEKGYLEEPEIDISTGKLKKIYKAPSREKLKEALLEWYQKEVYEPVIYDLNLEDSVEISPEEAYLEERKQSLSLISAKDLRKLREGLSIKEAVKLLEGYTNLFEYEIAGLITVNNGIVKLTEKGLKAILEEWIPEIEEKLKELKEFDFNEYKKLLAKYCQDLK